MQKYGTSSNLITKRKGYERPGQDLLLESEEKQGVEDEWNRLKQYVTTMEIELENVKRTGRMRGIKMRDGRLCEQEDLYRQVWTNHFMESLNDTYQSGNEVIKMEEKEGDNDWHQPFYGITKRHIPEWQ
ncbi:hypothetical protein QE152_g33813 [Popillia japonica]|uniref:Uncharacterized protein n=1 Tax=Popillia japonica TaxID=7064 RepID=A0AAW1IW55_POPJA